MRVWGQKALFKHQVNTLTINTNHNPNPNPNPNPKGLRPFCYVIVVDGMFFCFNEVSPSNLCQYFLYFITNVIINNQKNNKNLLGDMGTTKIEIFESCIWPYRFLVSLCPYVPNSKKIVLIKERNIYNTCASLHNNTTDKLFVARVCYYV